MPKGKLPAKGRDVPGRRQGRVEKNEGVHVQHKRRFIKERYDQQYQEYEGADDVKFIFCHFKPTSSVPFPLPKRPCGRTNRTRINMAK